MAIAVEDRVYSHKHQQAEDKDDSRAPAIAKKQTRVAKPIRLRCTSFFSDLDQYTSPNVLWHLVENDEHTVFYTRH